MHFSGAWYDSGAQTYISQVQSAMLLAPWTQKNAHPFAAHSNSS
jgi:hypothetical protein